jgi:hypothetical protein
MIMLLCALGGFFCRDGSAHCVGLGGLGQAELVFVGAYFSLLSLDALLADLRDVGGQGRNAALCRG